MLIRLHESLDILCWYSDCNNNIATIWSRASAEPFECRTEKCPQAGYHTERPKNDSHKILRKDPDVLVPQSKSFK